MDKKSFREILSVTPEELKISRVNNFVKRAKATAKSFITAKEEQVSEIEDKIDNMTDLGDNNSTDIAKRIQSINTKDLMRNIFEAHLELEDAKRDLKVLKETYKELFPEKED